LWLDFESLRLLRGTRYWNEKMRFLWEDAGQRKLAIYLASYKLGVRRDSNAPGRRGAPADGLLELSDIQISDGAALPGWFYSPMRTKRLGCTAGTSGLERQNRSNAGAIKSTAKALFGKNLSTFVTHGAPAIFQNLRCAVARGRKLGSINGGNTLLRAMLKPGVYGIERHEVELPAEAAAGLRLGYPEEEPDVEPIPWPTVYWSGRRKPHPLPAEEAEIGADHTNNGDSDGKLNGKCNDGGSKTAEKDGKPKTKAGDNADKSKNTDRDNNCDGDKGGKSQTKTGGGGKGTKTEHNNGDRERNGSDGKSKTGGGGKRTKTGSSGEHKGTKTGRAAGKGGDGDGLPDNSDSETEHSGLDEETAETGINGENIGDVLRLLWLGEEKERGVTHKLLNHHFVCCQWPELYEHLGLPADRKCSWFCMHCKQFNLYVNCVHIHAVQEFCGRFRWSGLPSKNTRGRPRKSATGRFKTAQDIGNGFTLGEKAKQAHGIGPNTSSSGSNKKTTMGPKAAAKSTKAATKGAMKTSMKESMKKSTKKPAGTGQKKPKASAKSKAQAKSKAAGGANLDPMVDPGGDNSHDLKDKGHRWEIPRSKK
jgi:hypothetical protein